MDVINLFKSWLEKLEKKIEKIDESLERLSFLSIDHDTKINDKLDEYNKNLKNTNKRISKIDKSILSVSDEVSSLRKYSTFGKKEILAVFFVLTFLFFVVIFLIAAFASVKLDSETLSFLSALSPI